jgi:hypothetical protein
MSVERKKPVSDREIIVAVLTAYKNGQNIGTVADNIGMKLGSLNQRIQAMRKLGVELPKLERRPVSGVGRRKNAVELRELFATLSAEINS